MNGMWQEKANIIPTNKEISYYLGYDAALSGYTDIIGSQCDCDMGLRSGSINVFVVREGGA